MKRNKHSLSHYRLLTADMGRLVPIACFEVLPGDTVQQATSLLLRCSPLLAPVMHPVSVRVHHWFVPNRLVWEGWEDFITGGPDGQGGDAGAFPVMSTGVSGVPTASIGDYLGIPTEVPDLEVSELPLRAYKLIFNEFYRDQDLVPELDDTYGPGDGAAFCAWEKDYFTSARLTPQKGPDISLPLGTSAPVVSTGSGIPAFVTASDPTNRALAVQSPDEVTLEGYVGATPSQLLWGNPRLIADLSSATAVNVNDVRLAFALQRYQEARSRFGSRYTEYLRYLGVRSSDARLQRPEYLGGGKQTIAFSEVLQTGPNSEEEPDDQGVGTLRGHGISAMRSRRYRRFFEEHGHVLSLLSVRPRTMYGNYLNKLWSRRTKEDYWQRELEHIGQQEVSRREVFAEEDPGGATLFGYQDRYAEYRHIQSSIHGDFRTTLNYWHLARQFGSAPALNESFVACDPSKRIFAEQTSDSLWIMANNSIQARRLVTRNASSRIL